MKEYEFVYRDRDGNRHVEAVDEARARALLEPTSHNVDEAIRVMRENPMGQMNCNGGYVRYAC